MLEAAVPSFDGGFLDQRSELGSVPRVDGVSVGSEELGDGAFRVGLLVLVFDRMDVDAEESFAVVDALLDLVLDPAAV